MANRIEITRRTDAALTAIRSVFGTEYLKSLNTADTPYGATEFVEFHLDELPSEYWQKHLGTTDPKPEAVLDLLVLRGHWGTKNDKHDPNGIESFDFTLPDNVTDNVICVEFDQNGQITRIDMES